MNVTPDDLAELRRLHAEEAAASKAYNAVSDLADHPTWQAAFDSFDRAHMRLYAKMVAHLIPLLDEIEAAHAERDRLRAALTDMRAGWRYIRQEHGDLPGVGWDRCEEAATAAIGATP